MLNLPSLRIQIAARPSVVLRETSDGLSVHYHVSKGNLLQ